MWPVHIRRILLSTIALSFFTYPLESIASIEVYPTLTEVIGASSSIGKLKIISGTTYEPTDEQGTIPCPFIYKGRWLDNFTNEAGIAEFASFEKLKIGETVLVFLSPEPPPRKLLSTSSTQEHRYQERLKREANCHKTQNLPKTIKRTTSTFLDKTFSTEAAKAEEWLEKPPFLRNELNLTQVTPTVYRIDNVEIDRVTLLNQLSDENKHQVVVATGWNIFGFHAVNWAEYREKIIQIVKDDKP
jgi:hypothetical protein